jgi:fructokinase
MTPTAYRLGIDLGGTKIEGAVLDRDGHVVARKRIAAPRHHYESTIAAIAALVADLEASVGSTCTVGIGLPGSLSPVTGLLQNANSTWLNSRPFDRDLAGALNRPVRTANDADCFALSEATDGAAAGAACVFGVILGTGCGGGLVVDGRLIDGPNGVSGEWGHTPLPWPTPQELDHDACWCGRTGCLETWLSGTALAADHQRQTGQSVASEAVVQVAMIGNSAAQATLQRHAHRLARGLAMIVNILDPDVIVLGGGLSKLAHLYETVPRLMTPYVFSSHPQVTLKPPRWGDASGVRGAAWLWP